MSKSSNSEFNFCGSISEKRSIKILAETNYDFFDLNKNQYEKIMLISDIIKKVNDASLELSNSWDVSSKLTKCASIIINKFGLNKSLDVILKNLDILSRSVYNTVFVMISPPYISTSYIDYFYKICLKLEDEEIDYLPDFNNANEMYIFLKNMKEDINTNEVDFKRV